MWPINGHILMSKRQPTETLDSLSFEERQEVEVESEGEDLLRSDELPSKRAHHNALERKRRDHIKESFTGLRDSVPDLQGEKASRAQILNKATDYIQSMRRKNTSHQQDIDDLKRQNYILEQQIRALEKANREAQQGDTSGQDSDESNPQI